MTVDIRRADEEPVFDMLWPGMCSCHIVVRAHGCIMGLISSFWQS